MSTDLLIDAVRPAYDKILRHRLPRKWGVYGEVPARSLGLFDLTDHKPNYKQGLIDAIEECIDDGDVVTLVGGGRGVSTVYCLWAGAERVIAYEATRRMLEIATETIAVQGLSDRVEWRHALVGDAVDLYGELEGAEVVSPADLSTHDVLVMDCEGAEKSILAGLSDYPDTIIVETHPDKGAPTGPIKQLIENAGYSVSTRQYGQNSGDKKVVVGIREG